jgi:predicted PurR-regulated permease PerM
VEVDSGANAQKIARYVLTGLLILLGGWMLRHFLSPLAWAVVLGIATSPWYERWLGGFRGRWRHAWAALTFTLLVGLLLILPLVYGGVMAVREAIRLAHSFIESSHNGTLEPPPWLLHLPLVGDWLRRLWSEGLDFGGVGADALPGPRPEVLEWTRVLGIEVFRRIVTLVFTLLTLYFVYRNRERLRAEVPIVCRRLFGPTVERLFIRAAEAIRATVDGVVIVALVEGAIMAGVYAAAGAPHPILSGAITGVFAMIPFAAPVVFSAVALLLFSQGAVSSAIFVFASGSILLFVADHFVRPAIIGGGAQLPFLWVLLGILGGIESFGLLGIFLGPALMAALVSLWRGWVSEAGPQPPQEEKGR